MIIRTELLWWSNWIQNWIKNWFIDVKCPTIDLQHHHEISQYDWRVHWYAYRAKLIRTSTFEWISKCCSFYKSSFISFRWLLSSPIALQRGCPVDLSQTTSVSLWLANPTQFTSNSGCDFLRASVASAITFSVLLKISIGSCSSHLRRS